MTLKDDGGQAFPVHSAIGAGKDGMSLRDYFAGQALAGFMANPEWGRSTANALNRFEKSHAITMAGFAYELADAMLVERGK